MGHSCAPNAARLHCDIALQHRIQRLEDIAEKTYPPRTRSLSFYLVLLFVVVPVWSVVPLSWAFVVCVLYSGRIWSLAWRGRLSLAVALCEVRFYDPDHFSTASLTLPTGLIQPVSLLPCLIYLESYQWWW